MNLISPLYTWSDITASLEDRSNLLSGVYYLQIDDSNCFRTAIHDHNPNHLMQLEIFLV